MNELTKRKPGRPALQKGLAKRVLVTLDDETINKAKRIGEKNLSAGVREAVRRYRLKD